MALPWFELADYHHEDDARLSRRLPAREFKPERKGELKRCRQSAPNVATYVSQIKKPMRHEAHVHVWITSSS